MQATSGHAVRACRERRRPHRVGQILAAIGCAALCCALVGFAASLPSSTAGAAFAATSSTSDGEATGSAAGSASEPLALTEDERAFAAEQPVLVVGMFPEREPLSYLADGQPAGVTKDVLDRIASDTGLSFQIVMLDDRPLAQQIEDFSLDAIAGLDPEAAIEGDGFSLSSSYCTARASVAFNAAHAYRDLSVDMVLATTFERAAHYEQLGYHVLSCPTVAACLDAVSRGEAAYTYENFYVVSAIMREHSFNNVLTVDATVQEVSSCLALTSPNDELLALLNKAIDNIYVGDVIAMVYDHTYANRTFTLREIIAQHPLLFALVIAIPLLAIAAAFGFIALTRSRAAKRDALTQLLNGPAFSRKAETRLRSGAGCERCMLVIDVDEFKDVNDRFGHFEGDETLKAIAVALKASCNQGELAARMGGDEFLAYWEDSSADQVRARANRLTETLRRGIPVEDGSTYTVSASVGVAFARPDESYDDLYRRADSALYIAKKAGKGRAAFDV